MNVEFPPKNDVNLSCPILALHMIAQTDIYRSKNVLVPKWAKKKSRGGDVPMQVDAVVVRDTPKLDRPTKIPKAQRYPIKDP